MVTYRITKIEANQPEKTVELTEQDFKVLMESVDQQECYLEDSQPSYDDDISHYFWQEASDEFEILNDKLMKFIHG